MSDRILGNMQLKQRKGEEIMNYSLYGEKNSKLLVLLILRAYKEVILLHINDIKNDENIKTFPLTIENKAVNLLMRRANIIRIGTAKSGRFAMLNALNDVKLIIKDDENSIDYMNIYDTGSIYTTNENITVNLNRELLEYIDLSDKFYNINLDVVSKFERKHSFVIYDKLCDVAQRNWNFLSIHRTSLLIYMRLQINTKRDRFNEIIQNSIDELNFMIPNLNLTFEEIYTTVNKITEEKEITSIKFNFNNEAIKYKSED